MKYEFALDIQKKAEEIAKILFPHVQLNNVRCYRSYGTSSKRIIARCHALGKLMQKAMVRQAFYVLEFLSERFDKFDEEEKTKIIIHELMHIPKCFGGGFKHHNVVTEKNVEMMFKTYRAKKEMMKNKWFADAHD